MSGRCIKRTTALVASTLALAIAMPASAEAVRVVSPNGRIAIEVSGDGEAGPTYSVSIDDKTFIAPSPVGLTLDIGDVGGGPVKLASHVDTKVASSYELVVGKAKVVEDYYNQSDIGFAAEGRAVSRFNLIVRAYDDGVAFRIAIPQQGGIGDFAVRAETTQFNFTGDFDCWGAIIGRFDTSFEAEYDQLRASNIHDYHAIMDPLVCKTGNGQTTFAIAESDVKDYPGFYLAGRGDGGLGVRTLLPPRFDTDRNVRFKDMVVARGELGPEGFHTPWRAIMIGDTPGALSASTLITTLASPSTIKDTSWIKPGKAAWDWWNGWAVDIPDAGVNTATYKAFVDFAASMKLDDILIDEGWSVGSSVEPDPNADVTRPIAAMDMPALLSYAKGKGIGVWVWLQWSQLDRQMEEALATYEKWGIKGIKIDFMNRNDQEMVDWYHKVLSLAAAHHLMVDLHGAYPPNGLARTYPNYLTQEGVLGAENNKWSGRITATHNVTLPFTRMILGPMDYTPGGFRSVPPAEFPSKQRFIAPFVKTTRGQAIAMYVVYDSPFQMVSDSPSAYHDADGSWADGAEFISAVPTTWDETRSLQGDIGQFIVTARRKGDIWYVGAMTNEDGRTVTVPLNFLNAGAYEARIYQDGADINHLRVSDVLTDSGQSLTLKLAPSGGGVIVLTPQTTSARKKR